MQCFCLLTLVLAEKFIQLHFIAYTFVSFNTLHAHWNLLYIGDWLIRKRRLNCNYSHLVVWSVWIARLVFRQRGTFNKANISTQYNWSSSRQLLYWVQLKYFCVLCGQIFQNPDVSGLLSLHQWKMPLHWAASFYSNVATFEARAERRRSFRSVSKKADLPVAKHFSFPGHTADDMMVAVERAGLHDVRERRSAEGRLNSATTRHKSLSSYIKGSQHALEVFRDFNFFGEDKLIFTMDISSLYTVIPNSEGLQALRYCFDQRIVKEPSSETLLRLAQLVLTLNCFSFAGNYYNKLMV